MINKIVSATLVISALGVFSFLDLSGPSAGAPISGGRCWVAGQVVCCLTPEGVQCH